MAEEYYEEEYDTHRHWDNEVSFNDVLAEQLKKDTLPDWLNPGSRHHWHPDLELDSALKHHFRGA